MATRYQDVTYGGFGGGIDQLSPESKIPDDYVELLENIDPTPNGSLVKRAGTQLYGSVPVRVERLEYERVSYSNYDAGLSYARGAIVRYNSLYYRAKALISIGETPVSPNNDWEEIEGGELCFYFDISVDVLSLRSTPIYAFGKTSEGHAGGVFSDELRGKYFPKFTTDIRQAIEEATETSPGVYTNTTTELTLEGNTHNQGSLLSLNIYRSLATASLANEYIQGTSYLVDKATGDVTVSVETGNVNDSSSVLFDAFIVAKSCATELGSSYVYTGAISCAAAFLTATPLVQVSIPAGIHNLNTFDILADCYIDDGTSYERIIPHSYTIEANGTVTFEFAYYQDFNLVVCLRSVPTSQTKAQLIEEGEINETIIIDNPQTPFFLFQLFQEVSGTKVAIYGSTQPNNVNEEQSSSLTVTSLSANATDYRATFYVTNINQDPNTNESFTAYAVWDYARVVSNKICVEAEDPVVDNYSLVIPGTEHKLGDLVSTVILQSTNPTNENNRLIQYDSVITDTTSDDITVSITNETGSNLPVTAALFDRSASSGAYVAPATTAIPANASTTLTITAATHGKGVYVNLVLFKVNPTTGTVTSYMEEPVADLSIDSSGNITAIIQNDTNDAYAIRPVVYAVPVGQTATSGSIATGSTGNLTLTGLTSSYLCVNVYTVAAGIRTLIVPDAISVNSISSTATIAVTNNTGSSITIEARWDYADYTKDADIPLTSSGGLGYIDNNPQMTIWGIPHRQLYAGATGLTPGYVTHLDVYRAQAEERPICGLGGNIFASYTYDESSSILGLGEYFPNLRARVASSVVIGPAFVAVSGSSDRTQGVLKFTNAVNNQAYVVSSTYLGSSQVKYRLYLPLLTIVGSLSTIFNTSEFLTISEMGYAVNNGDFQIISASLTGPYVAGTNQYIDVIVTNPNVDSSDWNEASPDGRAGIFTDRIPIETACPFFEGDRLLSAGWGPEQFLLATGTSAGNEVRLEGLYTNVIVPDGLLLVGSRTSRIVPLRSINAISTTENLVAGDILSFTDIDRELRAKFVNPRADETVRILSNNPNSAQKNIQVVVFDSNLFQVGQRILLLNAGVFTGEQVVAEIISPTLIRLDGNIYIPTEITQAVIFGYNVEVDENFVWSDSLTSTNSFRVARRWIPVEEPSSDYLQLPKNRYRYFSSNTYDNQPFLRSTMVNDTLYFTNGLDAVQRYDGQSLTRAGFFRWQAAAYLTQDTTVPKITTVLPSITSGITVVNNSFKVTLGEQARFQIGNTIRFTRTVNTQTEINEYIITDINADAGNGYIVVNANGQGITTGSSMTLKKVGIYSYYYRLNLIDANNNRIVSAVTGAQDYRIPIATACVIRHLLIRPPFLDNFDFDRIEIQIYRTKLDSTQPYYLVGSVEPNWYSSGEAYIEFIDQQNDNTIQDSQIDVASTVLIGKELGQTWSGPIRSKYLTSTSNSLVLANIKSWPTLSIQAVKLPQADKILLSDFENRKVLLRKDNADTGTTTDNINRQKFEFVHEGQKTINASLATVDYDTNELNITSMSHGLTVGDWVYLFHYDPVPHAVTDVNPRLGGYYQVSSVFSVDIFAITVSNALIESIAIRALSATVDVNAYVTATTKTDIPVWLSTDKLYDTVSSNLLRTVSLPVNLAPANPTVTITGGFTTESLDLDAYLAGTNIPSGTRVLSITNSTTFEMTANATSGGNSTITVSSPLSVESYAFSRLAVAINAAQAACSTANFIPWVVANAGGEYINSEIVLETPYVSSSTLEVVLPDINNMNVFVNGIRRLGNESVQAITQLMPSRLLVSYANYPELFDAPMTFLDTDSESAIDVNPSDGQQITGVIPFFGESAFKAAQKDAILLVFKTASVYVVNIANKREGLPCVQKLDTRGLGCTAPYSIAPTQNGIMFANQSGIYRITRNYECQYIGRRMERLWKEEVDKDNIDLYLHGHYYPLGNQYKVSLPYTVDELRYPTKTFVYNTTREYTADGYRDGSWTMYSNQPVVGWANMLERPLMASPQGEVFTLRMTGTDTDYNDDGQAINGVATLRALDFGSASVRKMVSNFNLQFRPGDTDSSVTVESSIDLLNRWEVLDAALVSRYRASGNITNRITQDLSIIQYMSNQRKGVFYQLRISNDSINQGLQLNGASVMVAGLGPEGIIQARETKA